MDSSPNWLPGNFPRREDLERELQRRAKIRGQRTERERLELSLAAYFQAVWHEVLEQDNPLVWGWHLQVICDHIQAMLEDWIRAQLVAIGEVRAVPTEPLPEEEEERMAELRRRSAIGRTKLEAQRLGILLPDEKTIGLLDKERQPQPIIQRARDLDVNVPPGSSKTSIIMLAAPTWMWLRWPGWRSICLSANPGMMIDMADRAREIIRNPWYQKTFEPTWTLSESSDAKGFYRNSAGGFRLSAGYFAKILGGRGDALLVDDPDDGTTVFSKTVRESTHRRWDTTLRNRLNDKRRSLRIVIQQRVHTEDTSGHVLSNPASQWEHLRIAQEYRAPQACFRDKKGVFTLCASCRRGESFLGWKDTRAVGELMDKVRNPPEVLAEEKANNLIWEAQHQQEPMQMEGNVFKSEWWHFWRFAWQPEPPPELAARCITIPGKEEWPTYFEDGLLSADLTFKKTVNGSRVCIGAWGRKGRHKILLGLRWDIMSFPETRRALRSLIAEFPWIVAKLVEDEANGPAILAELKDPEPGSSEPAVEGLIAVEPEGSKEERAHSVSSFAQAGDVVLPLWVDWRDEAIAEAAAFPKKGERNDFVDQLSQALRHWKKAGDWRSLYE